MWNTIVFSIFRSYDNSRLELIVINDNSSDSTAEILKGLKKTYNFRFIDNKVNMGKVKSINSGFLARMLEIEYGMISILQTAYNSNPP